MLLLRFMLPDLDLSLAATIRAAGTGGGKNAKIEGGREGDVFWVGFPNRGSIRGVVYSSFAVGHGLVHNVWSCLVGFLHWIWPNRSQCDAFRCA